MKLTLAVSTVYSNLDRALLVFDGISEKYCESIECIIICQNDRGLSHSDKIDGVKVYYQPVKGLSKSRNYAIKKALGTYIWFLDDDVLLKDDFISSFSSEKFFEYDLIFGRIYCSDAERPYKNYCSKRLRRFEMLRVSSIEIIAKRDFIESNNIEFDESLGLGSNYPSGEENIFLLSCYDSKAKIKDSDGYCIYHPCLEAKRHPKVLWAKPGYPYSKYNVARALGGCWGVAYALKTLYRAIKSGVPLSNVALFFKS